jgi:hypothetical protein
MNGELVKLKSTIGTLAAIVIGLMTTSIGVEQSVKMKVLWRKV